MGFLNLLYETVGMFETEDFCFPQPCWEGRRDGMKAAALQSPEAEEFCISGFAGSEATVR